MVSEFVLKCLYPEHCNTWAVISPVFPADQASWPLVTSSFPWSRRHGKTWCWSWRSWWKSSGSKPGLMRATGMLFLRVQARADERATGTMIVRSPSKGWWELQVWWSSGSKPGLMKAAGMMILRSPSQGWWELQVCWSSGSKPELTRATGMLPSGPGQGWWELQVWWSSGV